MTGPTDPGVHVDEEGGTIDIAGSAIRFERVSDCDLPVGIHTDGLETVIVAEEVHIDGADAAAVTFDDGVCTIEAPDIYGVELAREGGEVVVEQRSDLLDYFAKLRDLRGALEELRDGLEETLARQRTSL